jgi:hypothetical protein
MSHSGYNRVYFATTSVHSERSPTEKEAAVKDFAAGSLVRHQTLGTGKVVAVEPTALHVFFPASDTRYAAKLRWPTAGSFLSRDDLDRDPWLEGLTSFAMDSASGRYALAANFISQDEAVAAYLAEHPGAFQVTTAATPRSGPSRGARWRSACAEWVSVMGEGQAEKLLEDGRYEELARRAARVAARAATIPGMIETEVLAEAFETGDVVRHFFEALFGFLSVPAPARARFDRLSRWGSRPTPHGRWRPSSPSWHGRPTTWSSSTGRPAPAPGASDATSSTRGCPPGPPTGGCATCPRGSSRSWDRAVPGTTWTSSASCTPPAPVARRRR